METPWDFFHASVELFSVGFLKFNLKFTPGILPFSGSSTNTGKVQYPPLDPKKTMKNEGFKPPKNMGYTYNP